MTALLVGGVGVASAVATFVDRRRKVIATFKSLGATGRMVFGIFLLQVGLMAAIGVVIGVAAGYLVPGLLDALYGDALPIRAELSVSGRALHRRRPTASSSRSCSRSGRWGAPRLAGGAVPRRGGARAALAAPLVIGLTLACAAALVTLAIATSDTKRIAVYFCAGLVLVFAVFLALGTVVTWAARRAGDPAHELALAIGNLGAPGG